MLTFVVVDSSVEPQGNSIATVLDGKAAVSASQVLPTWPFSGICADGGCFGHGLTDSGSGLSVGISLAFLLWESVRRGFILAAFPSFALQVKSEKNFLNQDCRPHTSSSWSLQALENLTY